MKKETSDILKLVQRIIFIVIAALISAINIKSFVRAGGLLPGGFTGFSLLIQEIVLKFVGIEIPFSVLNISLNAVPVVICFKAIGKKFTLLSCLMIFLSSIFTDLIPAYPVIYDTLLISIFGGIISGFTASICLFAGATGGGTDFIAIYISEKFGMDAFNYILIVNAVMLVIAGAIFGWEKALYSIIFQFTATQMVHVCYKRYKQNTLLIITDYPTEIVNIINQCTHHGSTMIPALGSYEHKERTLVYSVVSSDEVKKVISLIKAYDNQAFINVVKTETLAGRFYHRPND